jgi:chitinase
MFRVILSIILISISAGCLAQSANKKVAPLNVIAYYAGNSTHVDSFDMGKLTHIIYSFCYLKGNRLNVDNKQDSLTIQKLVQKKKAHPQLKVLLSLGGWGGCKTCSDVFNTEAGRHEFAQSTKQLLDYFGSDGIDLDWEYPTIEGYPGHAFIPADKTNFTKLIMALRTTLGQQKVVSFAAGGFVKFLEESVEWKKIMPLLDFVNLMTYDLTNGFSTVSGHHTPLYSTSQQIESTANAVCYLDSIGIPRNKLVIGAAFYARVFENSAPSSNGLYQPTKFKRMVSYRDFNKAFYNNGAYQYYWDAVAQAPYMYNAAEKLLVTFDDTTSMRLKTQYAIDKGLNGIMFWQLMGDTYTNGLLDVIDATKKEKLKMKNVK